MTAARKPNNISATDFVRQEFAWLAQVAADGTLPATSLRLAIVLIAYFNRETLTAYPAISTLAERLQVAERSVQRALAALMPRHLTVSVGGGRSRVNVYRWKIDVADSNYNPRQPGQGLDDETPIVLSPIEREKPRQGCQGLEPETPTGLSRNPDSSVAKTPTELSPEPLEENLFKEPTSGSLRSPEASPAARDPICEQYEQLVRQEAERKAAKTAARAKARAEDVQPAAMVQAAVPTQPFELSIAKAPIYRDARHELWAEGPIMLAELGVPESQRRSNIGKWMRDTGDDAKGVLDAIARARDHRPAGDPIPWIIRALTRRAKASSGGDHLARLARECDEEMEFGHVRKSSCTDQFDGPTLDLVAEIVP
jgi:hypothetical protein